MNSNLLPDNQAEARRQVQQAVDYLFQIWKRQNDCCRRMFAAERFGRDDTQLRNEMYGLCRQYTEQDDKCRLLEETYHKQFFCDLEPFRVSFNLGPN